MQGACQEKGKNEYDGISIGYTKILRHIMLRGEANGTGGKKKGVIKMKMRGQVRIIAIRASHRVAREDVVPTSDNTQPPTEQS